jgi:hypothetical protein
VFSSLLAVAKRLQLPVKNYLYSCGSGGSKSSNHNLDVVHSHSSVAGHCKGEVKTLPRNQLDHTGTYRRSMDPHFESLAPEDTCIITLSILHGEINYI